MHTEEKIGFLHLKVMASGVVVSFEPRPANSRAWDLGWVRAQTARPEGKGRTDTGWLPGVTNEASPPAALTGMCFFRCSLWPFSRSQSTSGLWLSRAQGGKQGQLSLACFHSQHARKSLTLQGPLKPPGAEKSPPLLGDPWEAVVLQTRQGTQGPLLWRPGLWVAAPQCHGGGRARGKLAQVSRGNISARGF